MRNTPNITRVLVSGVVLALAGLVAPDACAGGGPENVLLVVNANRDDSKRVANHYVRLRNVPASNVLSLDYTGDPETETGDTFRQQILLPVLRAIDERGLSAQIDVVAYSCGFPWRIDLRDDFPKDKRPPRTHTPRLSLTGATYFWQAVMSKQPVYLVEAANFYAVGAARENRARCTKLAASPSRAFRGRYRWRPGGVRAPGRAEGMRYLLSTVLGVTTGRGNTVEEVVQSLQRSVAAEESPPRGVFAFVKNSGVRSTTRDKCFPAAVDQLERLGAQAAVMKGELPPRGTRVAGMTLGAALLDLANANLQIEPGAICEHLTSSGGDLTAKAYQTPLTDLIRSGAAGASGTVWEPYALQWKFPLPSIQVHYRRGCSLAEAFYQSVGSPYQLLIVGDPLCQPWARRPGLSVAGFPSDAARAEDRLQASALDFVKPLTGSAPVAEGRPRLTPLATLASESQRPDTPGAPAADAKEAARPTSPDEPPALNLTAIVTPASSISEPGDAPASWELFIDGRLARRLPSGKSVQLSQRDIGPGWHEVRVVGVDSGPIEAQRRQIGSVEENGSVEGDEEASATPTLAARVDSVGSGESLVCDVKAPGADGVVLRHNSRIVGRLTGPVGVIRVEGATVGTGPVRLQAQAEPSGARSAPIWVTVRASPVEPAAR
ncbi:MAG: TIGR03790 family protein [Planctomycetota bacterium]